MIGSQFLKGALAAALMLVPAHVASGQHVAAPAPKPVASAPFNSDRISVVVTGSGSDVIMIPGLTASRDVWKAAIAATPGYRYHLVQVNGFAGTEAQGNASGTVVEPVAQEIARYIREKGLKAPALVGHSMGGTLAMMIAARAPQVAGRVMVVDMQPQPAFIVGSDAARARSLAEGLRGALDTPGGRRLLGGIINRFGADDPARTSDPDLVARATHDLALLDLRPELPKIAAPLTVLFATAASGDPQYQTAVDDYRRAYAGANTARLRPVQNSGHMIMYDQPARFAEELKRFLRD
jgi:N-formylmaleamate deformylase